MVKLLACLFLPSDLAVCTCHCAKRTLNFLISNIEKHVSLLLRKGFRSSNFILTNLILLKSSSHPAPSQQWTIIPPHSELFPSPLYGIWEPTYRFQLHKCLRIIIRKIWSHPVSHRGDPVTTRSPIATYQGQAGRSSNCSSGRQPRTPRSQPSSRSNNHRHRQREHFSSHWIHSITGLLLRSIRLLPCYFITRAPRAEVILTQRFFSSNNRFHSCLQRSWLVCLILAMLTHPARVPWSV